MLYGNYNICNTIPSMPILYFVSYAYIFTRYSGIVLCVIYQIIHHSTNHHEQQFSLIDNYSHLYLIPTIIQGINFKIPHSIYYPLNHFQIHLFQIFSKRNKIVSLHEHLLEPPIIPITMIGIRAIINATKRCKHKIFRKS